MPRRPSRLRLLLELLVLFIGGPLLVLFDIVPIHPFTILWLATVFCLVVLVRDPTFRSAELWRFGELRRRWRPIVIRFVALAGLLGIAVVILAPERLFAFVQQRPGLWAIVMVLYPILSVYPQGIVYRAFVLHRYRRLVPGRLGAVLLSAVLFAFVHVVLENGIAVALTFVGGALFAHTHVRSRSLAVSSFEHALYGCFIFTIGLGWYFYLGAGS